MITELAVMTVEAGSEAEFETALAKARVLVETSPGCLGLTVAKGIERPTAYLITIQWRELADHLKVFRTSENYTKWRELLSPFYAEPPSVEHWTPVA